MRPFLFQLGDTGIPTYWVLAVIGFSAAIYFVWKEARREGLDPNPILDLCLVLIVCAVVGARLMHVLAEEDPLVPGRSILYFYLEHPADVFKVWNGLAFYGGFLLCLPAAWLYLRLRRLPQGRVFDLFGVALPLGLFFGRLGCFFAGCCHGKPTDLPWGMTFTDLHSLARPLGEPLHPTQLYEALFCLTLFFLLWFHKRALRKFDGQVFLSFAALYSAGRFLLEFLRADNRGMFFGGLLSSSQIVAIGVFAVAVIWLLWAERRRKIE